MLVFSLFVSSALVWFFQLPVHADQSVLLTWDPSSAPDVAGYKMYFGTQSQDYTNVVAVGNTTNATISGLVAGTTYYFAATTVDSDGDESDFSNEAIYTVPLVVPMIMTLPTAGAITYGQTLASSSLTGGEASTDGSFAFTTPELAPDAGAQNVSVTFTPADADDDTSITAMVPVMVNQAAAAITLGSLNQSYDGTAKPVSVTTSPAGLDVEVTYNASTTVPVNAGSYLVVATVNDPNYAGSATSTLVIGQATASVTLANLNQPYDGTAKLVSVTTSPAGLDVEVTYNAFSTVPTNAGCYLVVATVNDPNYTGGATNTLVIVQAVGDQSVLLTWDPSSAPDVVGYNIYFGTACRKYSKVVAVGNTTNATIPGLVAGATYYFAATTVDSNGDESDFSNEAIYTVPLVAPTDRGPASGDADSRGRFRRAVQFHGFRHHGPVCRPGFHQSG